MISKSSRTIINSVAVLAGVIIVAFLATNHLPTITLSFQGYPIDLGMYFSAINSLAMSYLAAWFFYLINEKLNDQERQKAKRDRIASRLGRVLANYELFEKQTGLNIQNQNALKLSIDLVNKQHPDSDKIILLGSNKSAVVVQGDFIAMVNEWYKESIKLLENAIAALEDISKEAADQLKENLQYLHEETLKTGQMYHKIDTVYTFHHFYITGMYEQAIKNKVCPPLSDSVIEEMKEYHLSLITLDR